MVYNERTVATDPSKIMKSVMLLYVTRGLTLCVTEYGSVHVVMNFLLPLKESNYLAIRAPVSFPGTALIL
jgi:hypothetical protein